jgi:hypothetical protein
LKGVRVSGEWDRCVNARLKEDEFEPDGITMIGCFSRFDGITHFPELLTEDSSISQGRRFIFLAFLFLGYF